jgi:hypothetical protein
MFRSAKQLETGYLAGEKRHAQSTVRQTTFSDCRSGRRRDNDAGSAGMM